MASLGSGGCIVAAAAAPQALPEVVGNRVVVCPQGHVDHADANAGFNIALRPSIGRFNTDRDVLKGNTDIPKDATL